jgi:hypothetical protein
MPSSVTDRLNTTTEQIFHLVPSKQYYYDLDAIREPHAESTQKRAENSGGSLGWVDASNDNKLNYNGKEYADTLHEAGKNPGDVFEVTTKPFPQAHFAVYPPELCAKPIKATAPKQVCAACGAPYERDVERKGGPSGDHNNAINSTPADSAGKDNNRTASGASLSKRYREHGYPERVHKGWTRTCECDTEATQSGIVLDPFAGAGTTLLKAKELDRRFIGIELNEEYADMARARVGLSPHDPAHVREDDNQHGLDEF